MFIEIMAKRARCSKSFLGKLIKEGKIKAELKPTKTGRKSWNITSPVDEVKSFAKKTGWHKTSVKSTPKSNLLSELIEWRAIPVAKRSLLLSLSKYSIKELRILVELVK